MTGSDITQAGDFNILIIAADVTNTVSANLSIKITGLDCIPKNFIATPAVFTLTQLGAPASSVLSTTSSASQCGTYQYSISSAPLDFVVLSGQTITFTPTLSTAVQTYSINATATMVSTP